MRKELKWTTKETDCRHCASVEFGTINSIRIQAEALKLLLPQGHSSHLTQLIQQSLRAAAEDTQIKDILIDRNQKFPGAPKRRQTSVGG